MKRMCVILVISVMLLGLVMAASATARQWTYRAGGESVEGELIDVKEGNVVLKKTDGSQTSIPLNKLSLGDIKYVQETLKEAEEAITKDAGSPQTAAEPANPAAVSTKAAAPSSPSPSPGVKLDDAATAALKKLHYNWKKDDSYVYRFRLLGDRGNETENRTGNITFKVKSNQYGEVSLMVKSNLKYESDGSPSGHVVIVGRHVHFASDVDKPKEMLIRVDPDGRILESKGEAPLPYLLGDLSELVIEPLPKEEKASWTINSDPGIAVVSVQYPYFRSSMTRFREGVPANEKTTYTVQEVKDNMIVIAKKYEMTSAAAIAGKPRIEANGSGKLKFDIERGVFSSLDFDMHVTVRDTNKTEETPLHLSYQLLTEEEIAEAAAEEQKAKDEKARPLNESELKKTLADLVSSDKDRVETAAKLLSEKKPEQPNPEIAKALEKIMLSDKNNVNCRTSAAQALESWSTKENIPGLIKALRDQWPPVQSHAVNALCEHMPKEAVKPVAAMLPNMQTRAAAIKFLKEVGPDAEPMILAQWKGKDPFLLAEICKLLGEIGTKKSLPTLEKASKEDNWMINSNAKKAIDAINAREEDADASK
jgi:HEAT repeat protein